MCAFFHCLCALRDTPECCQSAALPHSGASGAVSLNAYPAVCRVRAAVRQSPSLENPLASVALVLSGGPHRISIRGFGNTTILGLELFLESLAEYFTLATAKSNSTLLWTTASAFTNCARLLKSDPQAALCACAIV